MWTDGYDRVDDGLYLHDPGMPLEVWVGELLGPDPIECKLPAPGATLADYVYQTESVKVVETSKPKGTLLGGLSEWEEKKSYWHKDGEGKWTEEENPWHPEHVKQAKADALHDAKYAKAKLALQEQLLVAAAKDSVFFEQSEHLHPGKVVTFSKYELLDAQTIKQAVEYLKQEGAPAYKTMKEVAEELAAQGYGVELVEGEPVVKKVEDGKYVVEGWKQFKGG